MNKNKKMLTYAMLAVGVFGFLIVKSVQNQDLASITSGMLNTGHGGSVTAPATNSGSPQQAAQLAPDFTLTRLDGGTITLSDYRGDKPVILDFWTSWCPNCQRDMPKLARWYEKYKDQVEVIGVNLRESNAVAQRFVNSRGIGFPIAMDPGSVANQFAIRFTNTHVLIDKEGSIVRVIPGDMKERDIRELIDA